LENGAERGKMKRRAALGILVAVATALFLSACSRTMRSNEIRLGFKASEEERWDEALVFWEKAVAADPRSVPAYNNLAVAYEKMGRWKDAEKAYEAALSLDPENLSVRHNFERFQENLAVWNGVAGKPAGGGADED
jgi:Tfp pilus assembly protein PilF